LNIPNPTGLHRHDLISRISRGLQRREEAARTEGVLEVVNEGYGFLRSREWNYLPGPDDVYVSSSQIRRFGLRTGDAVVGRMRRPRRGERYPALLHMESVNGGDLEAAVNRPHFDDLRPEYPSERLHLEAPGADIAMRVVDIIGPIGKGQRGLIVSPPKAGKTVLLQQMAYSIAANHPEVHLIVLLIDERPEEVTDMEAHVNGEVIASTFDEPASRHTQVGEIVIEKAKRLVESGRDVVILLDSLTRLARAHNTVMPRSGKILSGGVDANAMQKPKKFFGSARKIAGGGSLTIIATALIETGSRMDDVIFEEFKGTGNMELILDRRISDKRIFPALDINRSGTRKEELLLSEHELNRIFLLRNFLADMREDEAIEFLIERMGRTETNTEFFAAMAKGG
jgi:transcription termination factor Rho